MRRLKSSESAELNPAPALNAPVCPSFTSTTTFMRSSAPVRRVVMLTSLKNPRRCSASRLLRSLVAEKSSCSWRRISRRTTWSRVLVLPVTSMRSTVTWRPRSTWKAMSTVFSSGCMSVWGSTVAKA